MLVFDRQDRPFMALEAQLSPMTPQDARMRTDRYAADGVAVCWASMEKRPWERGVPSLRVAPPRNRGLRGIGSFAWAAIPEPLTVPAAPWSDLLGLTALADAGLSVLVLRVRSAYGSDQRLGVL